MTKQVWMAKVEANKVELRSFICNYHPANLRARKPSDKMATSITAPQAERACEIVREQIRRESLDFPEMMFDIALAKGDSSTISSLLSSSWFGVPESTDCWRIEGFGTAVDLLDDPVEFDGPLEE